MPLTTLMLALWFADTALNEGHWKAVALLGFFVAVDAYVAWKRRRQSG